MHPIDRELGLMLQGKMDEARKISDVLEKSGPSAIQPIANKSKEELWLRHTFNRGWFCLQQGLYREGSQRLDAGRSIGVYGGPKLMTSAPVWNPEEHSLDGKTILLSMEGGYGDEMIHVRFATTLKQKFGAAHVYVICSPGLVSLFNRVAGVTRAITHEQISNIPHDYWLPGFSAGWVCGHTNEDLYNGPYLSALSQSVDMWSGIIKSELPKVGIRWAGNPKFEHQQFRRFPPEYLTGLGKCPGLQVYSLQKESELLLPKSVVDLQHMLISWEDTAAAIQNLDLVVTSCTSVAHLSAAMGKETWVVVPILPYHTWAYKAPESTTSPYYGDNVRIFRQQEAGSWDITFRQLYAALEEKFKISVPFPQQKQVKRLNLGCGRMRLAGFHNVDIDKRVEPDQVVDLDRFPWPWKDNEFQHIVAKDVLEHLGNGPKDLTRIVQEMYRISSDEATWEIQFPHHRSDHAFNDPTHVRVMTPATFKLYSKAHCEEVERVGFSDSRLALEAGVDIQVLDVQYEYTPFFQDKLVKGEITNEGLEVALHLYNNVAQATRLLIKVIKPGKGQ